MNIHIIAAALPPKLDGIGDYTANLAAELAKSTTVTVLTGALHPDPIPGVRIETAFCADDPSSVRQIVSYVEADKPDWVLLQYNPFSYGRWGLNLHLPEAIRHLRTHMGVSIAIMAHETFMPVVNWQSALMTLWQRWQFRQLGRTADVLFFSTEASAAQYQQKFHKTPMIHLPVGSNIPYLPYSRQESRAGLGILEETLVLGLFGTMHISRMLARVKEAYQVAEQFGKKALVLYVGPHAQAVRNALGDTPLISEGTLSAAEISRRFAMMDIYLTPFIDGISTRRGTVICGLQHGVALVGTCGYNTDSILKAEDGRSFLLAGTHNPRQFSEHLKNMLDQPELRASLGRNGQEFFHQNFTWGCISSKLLASLEAAS